MLAGGRCLSSECATDICVASALEAATGRKLNQLISCSELTNYEISPQYKPLIMIPAC